MCLLQRGYYFDKYVFNIIDTEEKAYWLGFIWCDGYVCRRKRKNATKYTYEFKLTLAEQDEKHLYKFKEFLKSEHPIKSYKCSSGFTANGCEKRIYIANVDFSKNLYHEYGLIPNRSDPGKMISKIPYDLIKHFIRGVIDADGSIINSYTMDGKYARYKSTINISTYEELLNFIQDYLLNEKLINQKSKLTQRHLNRDENCKTVRYCGNVQVVRLINYLYIGSNTYLDRKYGKCLEIINMHK